MIMFVILCYGLEGVVDFEDSSFSFCFFSKFRTRLRFIGAGSVSNP